MRVALISDLHGNELALKAVLADIRQRGADQIVCLGDVATLGPHPSATLSCLRELGCVCILGNHDEYLLDFERARTYARVPVLLDSIRWTSEQLSPADREFIASFRRGLSVPLAEAHELRLFHGAPGSNETDLLATTAPDLLDGMLGGELSSVMAGGHTHIQMLRQHRGSWLVNPGSVGMPFKEFVNHREPEILAHAEYAIVSHSAGALSVELRRVDLDRRALHSAALSSDNPLAPSLAAMYA
ncbi:MAG: metallophosphoesterase family protein [Myxococcota bacterium]